MAIFRLIEAGLKTVGLKKTKSKGKPVDKDIGDLLEFKQNKNETWKESCIFEDDVESSRLNWTIQESDYYTHKDCKKTQDPSQLWTPKWVN